MEVARIFKLLDIKPKHTIRFEFFSGGEHGLLGSNAYAIKHSNELDKLKSILIMDDGSQLPKEL
jgi:Zn-dependent M28 family amino/carboxypeptidase